MMSQIVLAIGFLLVCIGFWGLLTRKDVFRIIISFSLLDTGVHVVMVGIGYVKEGTAPIFDEALAVAGAASKVVDPVPSALVLTAIVIGLAVTALMLSYAIRLHASKGSLEVDDLKELKW